MVFGMGKTQQLFNFLVFYTTLLIFVLVCASVNDMADRLLKRPVGPLIMMQHRFEILSLQAANAVMREVNVVAVAASSSLRW
jgi:hypothetical protein